MQSPPLINNNCKIDEYFNGFSNANTNKILFGYERVKYAKHFYILEKKIWKN